MRLKLALVGMLWVTPLWAANVTLVAPDQVTPLAASQSQPLYASESAANLATSQATVGSTSTLVCAARAGRRAATIENLGTTATWLGATGVTTTTGALLPGVVGAAVTIPTSAAIYGVVATGTQAVSCLETY